MQRSFELLKQKFSEYPVLQFPDFDKEFILETDANQKRLAALLNQLKDNLLALISCASRVLSKHEKNYGVTELELLCVSWAIEHFRPYLYGRTFQIITDHKAITTVMEMKKPTSKITRMLLQLQEYDYYFTFRPGKLHQAADALSRLPAIDDIEDEEEILYLESANELLYSNSETNLSENGQLELNPIQSAGNCSSNELSI